MSFLLLLSKKLYILVIVLGLLAAGGYLSVRLFLQSGLKKTPFSAEAGKGIPDAASALDLRPLFVAQLKRLVKNGSEGLYDLSADSLLVDVLRSEVVLTRVTLVPDTAALEELDRKKRAPDDVFKISFDTLRITRINLDDVITRKTIDFDTVRLTNPVIEVFRKKRAYNQKTKDDTITLYRRLMKDMKRIAVGTIETEGVVVVRHHLSKNKITRLSDVSLQLTDVLIDSTTERDKERFLFAKNARLTGRNFRVVSSDGLYQFGIKNFAVNAAQKNLVAENISLTPRYGKREFAQRTKKQKERFELHIPALTLRGVDWWALLNGESLIAPEATVTGARLNVYLDRSLPPGGSRIGSFPHRLVMKIPFPVHVAKLNVRDMDLAYEEFNPRSGKSGKLLFGDIQAKVVNVTNVPEKIKRNRYTTVTARARFLQRAGMQTTFRFDLARTKTGDFSVAVRLDSLHGPALNGIAEPIGLFSVDKGTVNSLSATVKGNDYKATGEVLLLYNDLNISILKKDETKASGFDEKGLISFLANRFGIKNHNPAKGEAPRREEGAFNRVPQAGFFNLVWKTMLVGILKTVGANPDLARPK